MRIGIIGLGLIGGSLGLALRNLNTFPLASPGEARVGAIKDFPPPLAGEGRVGAFDRRIDVVGVARTPEGVAAAEQRGAVDTASTDMAILEGADLVVIATPIDQIQMTMMRIRPFVAGTTLVTDVASVKRPVVEWAQSLPNPSRFLGGHPVAGKTQTGIDASDPSIFRDEPWIFTPARGQDLEPFQPWFEMVQAIGARPAFLAPEVHDQQMAYLSHLAFTVSAAFAETVQRYADPSLGGPGYRGMVRLAAGDPTMYESIARENRRSLVDAIDRFERILEGYRKRIDQGDRVRELYMAGQHVAV